MENLYDVKMDGIGKIGGGQYKDITITGIGQILNNIQGQKVNIQGVGKAKGNIKCNEIYVEGTLSCEGRIEVEDKINVSGQITVEENLLGREVYCDGKLVVNGLLSGDKIVIIPRGSNKITEIGGEEVIVKITKSGIIDVFFNVNKVISDIIEGNTISLENTICKVVRGHDIKINKGCSIDKVEYTGTLFVHDDAKVNEIVKL